MLRRVTSYTNRICLVVALLASLLLVSLVGVTRGQTQIFPAFAQATVFASTQTPNITSTSTPTFSPTITPSPTVTPSLGTLIQNNIDEILIAVISSILTVIGTLFVVYFQKVVSVIKAVFDWIWKSLRLERAIEVRYRTSLARELRSIQILQMTEAKNLETIFVPLKLGDWLPPDLRDVRHETIKKTISFSEALEQFQRVTIVGDPGSGKTTITSQAAASVADRGLRIKHKTYFPIYVHLRHLKEFLESERYNDKTLKDLLSEILDRFGFSESRRFLDRKIADGNCLIVLDGFDELADKEGSLQQRLAQKVDVFTSALPTGNRVILTSRAAGYEPAWFPGFRVLEMTNLSLPQTQHFIAGWFGKEQDSKAKALQRILESSDRLQLLVSNPLMLAIVCFVYQSKSPHDRFLPERRVDLYDRCIEALISKWDISRGIDREPAFSLAETEKVLRYIAYEALISEKIDFSRRELLALIRTHLPKIEERRQYEDEDFLQEVLQHTGIFKEKARDTMGFIHLTFQEYLAAQVIAEKVLHGTERKDLHTEMNEAIRSLANPRWTEPITLAAGILRGRTELVTLIM